jgi:4-aminobutyrate aminotransferase-like enzyme
MARAYNPRLSEAENARRLSQAADELEQLAKDKAGAIEHLRSKGTLNGFKPNTSASNNAPAGGVQNLDAVTAEMRRRGLLK